MTTFKRIAATVLASATIATGATVVAASPAEARIASGNYWYSAWNRVSGKRVMHTPVRIVGNRFYADSRNYRILVPTRRGAYFDYAGMRHNFWRAGNAYDGRQDAWTGRNRLRLTPR